MTEPPRKRRLNGLSLRLRLVLLTSVVLAAITAFLMLYLPAKLDTVVRVWVERRASGLATVISSAVAPGLEFDDSAQAQEVLSSLATTNDALYAAVRRGNGTDLATYKPERVPRTAAPAVDGPVTHIADGVLQVTAPIRTRGGEKGLLLLGFSLAEVQAERRANMAAVATICLTLLLLGLVATFFIGTLLGRPIGEITEIAQLIADGDLVSASTRLSALRSSNANAHASDNEVERLAHSFGTMLESLRETSLTLLESAASLSSSVDNLRSSTREQSEGITRQATALQESHTTAQEIRQTSQMASEKAASVASITERAEALGLSGETAIGETLDGLNQVRSRVEELARRISGLEGSAREIEQITQTVKDLANQTNMLALNAAIEASRSGEQGKGFSVVAREMRALADQSIQATLRVRTILNDVTMAISTAVEMTREGAHQIDSGFSKAETSGESLRHLAAIVRENSSAARQISAAVGQQGAGISQIFEAISDLSKMMDETLRHIERTEHAVKVVRDVSGKVATVASRYRV